MKPARNYRHVTREGGRRSSDGDSAKVIVAKVIERRASGHACTDAEVLAAHPTLKDELKRELKIADQIRQAMLATRQHGLPEQRLAALTESELEAPLSCSEEQETDEEQGERLPRIIGYLLVKEISRGGQAVVYRAIQESTTRAVAVKVMSGGPFANSRHRVRFEREAKILATIEHPNIVSIIERGRTPDGSFFFVMPFIEGTCLDEYWSTCISRDGSGLRELMILFSKVAHTIEQAHARGILHRDLKPANIIVDKRGEPHILDFGLARSIDEASDLADRTITQSGQIIGSLPWISPEQADGQSKELDAVSDVYSIGVMLFQALTGEFPYSLAGQVNQIVQRIIKHRAESPSKHQHARPNVDGRLDAIVLKALAKLPGDRYPSAQRLASDLEAWLAGGRLEAVVSAPPRRGRLFVVAAALSFFAIASPFAWRALRVHEPTVFLLPTVQNSVGMTLVKIPAGVFTMGSPSTEEGRNRDEHQHRETVDRPFFMETTPVTCGQYLKVMSPNPGNLIRVDSKLPIQNVTWKQATDFCRRLSKLEHATYRLPTEVEWEYACRANGTGPFPDPQYVEGSVWSIENSHGTVQQVALKTPNAWGLFDMQGNVSQWCSSIYSAEMSNPSASTATLIQRVIRGGSFKSTILRCRAASRSFASEEFCQPDLGFRVVRDP